MSRQKHIKQYIQDIIENGMYDLIKFLCGLFFTTTLGTGITYKITQLLTKNKCFTLIISVLSVVLFVAIFLLIYKRIRRYKYKIIEMKVNFEYKRDKVIVVSKITIKALRKGLDKVYHRTTWFPDEQNKISCLDKDFSIERLPKRDTSYEFNVRLNKVLKKGEIITYTVKVVNSNKKRHFQDFYSREIIIPVDKLIMTVVIPTEYGYRYITKETIKGSSYNDFSNKEKLEFLNTYTWEIEQPKLGYEYKLLWEKK